MKFCFKAQAGRCWRAAALRGVWGWSPPLVFCDAGALLGGGGRGARGRVSSSVHQGFAGGGVGTTRTVVETLTRKQQRYHNKKCIPSEDDQEFRCTWRELEV